MALKLSMSLLFAQDRVRCPSEVLTQMRPQATAVSNAR
jgi:hypothetical protein